MSELVSADLACTGCTGRFKPCICHLPKRKAVLLLNLGTPDAPTRPAVRRYLAQFLSDRYVIKLTPRWAWFTPILGRLIAFFRAGKSAAAYKSIWTEAGSPLKVITEQQVAKLQKIMGSDWHVAYAMRYANPSCESVIKKLVEQGITDLVIVPMYPQFAGPSTATALDDAYAAIVKHGPRLNVTVRNTWYDDALYIDAQAAVIADVCKEKNLSPDNAFLLYSTHSMPASYIRDGDPYEGQVQRSMELVNRRLGWPANRTMLSFQSKLGPVPWLTPATDAVMGELAEAGERNLLVCPISFTADCLETIEEIGVEYAELFAEKSNHEGVLHRIPAVNDDDRFIHAVAQLVRRGSAPADRNAPVEPILIEKRATLEETIDKLVMVGVSLAGRLEHDEPVSHVSADIFAQIKKPQHDSVALLQLAVSQSQTPATSKLPVPHAEAILWNTCQRFELYGFDLHVEGVRQHMGGEHAVVLRGQEAWRHLLRTAAGLGSQLPGDADVLEQLQSACRMAAHAGTGGPHVRRLTDEATAVINRIRRKTAWGTFAHDYTEAALASHELAMQDAKIVVVGGSTTSLSLLRHLTARHEVPQDQLTVIYRGVGRQRLVKMLRKLIGHGTRVRVDDYRDPAVVSAIAHADVLALGIDRKEPILTADDLRPLRDFSKRPLTVIDFNSFPSTRELDTLDGVRVIPADELSGSVETFADRLLADAQFAAARDEAEAMIRDAVKRPDKLKATRDLACLL